MLDGVADDIGRGFQVELVQHAAPIGADRLDAQGQNLGNLGGGLALGDHRHHLVFTVGETLVRGETAITARCHRLGWRVYATNAPVRRLTLTETVIHYRQGWCLERDFHLVKDLPLGLSPLFVWKEDQIKGLVRLLTLVHLCKN